MDLKQIEKEVLAENKMRMVKDDFQKVLPVHLNEQINVPEVSVVGTEEKAEHKITTERISYISADSSYNFNESELRNRVAYIHVIGTNLAYRPIECNRKFFKGLIIFVKRIIRKLIGWFVAPISQQQTSFNQETVMLTSRIVDEIRDMGNYVTDVVESGTREALGRISDDLNNLARRTADQEEIITDIAHNVELHIAEKCREAEMNMLDSVEREMNVLETETREALGIISGNFNNLMQRTAEYERIVEGITHTSEELWEAEKLHASEIGRVDAIVQELKDESQRNQGRMGLVAETVQELKDDSKRNQERVGRLEEVVSFLKENHLGETTISLANRMENEEKRSRLYQEQINQLLLSTEALQRDVHMLQEELNQQKPKYEFGSIMSSSQSGEDTIVAYILDSLKIPFNKCTYLDLGANHPMRMNNSFMLYRFGARGVLVEANPTLAEDLRVQRPGDVVLNCCITDTTGDTIKFFVMNGDGLSTFDAERVAQNMNANDLLRIEQVVNVKTITIQDVLNTYFREPPVVVSVDIEGDELATLKSLNLRTMRPLIVIVETIEYSPHLKVNHKKNDIIDYMEEMGYAEYAFTGINSIFVDVNRLHP